MVEIHKLAKHFNCIRITNLFFLSNAFQHLWLLKITEELQLYQYVAIRIQCSYEATDNSIYYKHIDTLLLLTYLYHVYTGAFTASAPSMHGQLSVSASNAINYMRDVVQRSHYAFTYSDR